MAEKAFDAARFAKVSALANDKGTTDGERAAARHAAEKIAARAGLTIGEAVADVRKPQQTKASFFDFFQEEIARLNKEKEPRRQEAIAEYGSIEAVFAKTTQESLLSASVEHLTNWGVHDGRRYVSGLDGVGDFLYFEDVPSSVLEAVSSAYPIPDSLGGVLSE